MSKTDKAIEEAKKQLTSEIDDDKIIVKAIKLLEQRTENLHKEAQRFRDWYALHFPELEREIDEDQELVRILSEETDREKMTSFESLAETSKGKKMAEEDLEFLREEAEKLSEGFERREDLEEYIEEKVKATSPNTSRLLGPILTAKIIALSGSLEDLAKSPSSTVQMLGAEKALFRFMSGDGSPPKHGVLFEHRFVGSLPEDTRGKMSRFMANKTVMAARLDLYGDKMKGNELREEAREKYEELKD